MATNAVRIKRADGTWQDIALMGPPGAPGEGMPTGGDTDHVLAKASAADYDLKWVEQTGGSGGGGVSLPDGGTTGQHLAKASNADGDADWVDVESITATSFQTNGWATASVSIPVNAWKSLAFGTSPAPTIEPAGAFTVNADGSVTVRDAGWYTVTASIHSGTASGATPLYMTISPSKDSDGYGNDSVIGPAGSYPHLAATMTRKLEAGEKVYVNCNVGAGPGSAAISVMARELSIARVGGPKGDKGDTGGNATVPMDTWHVVGAAGEPAYAAGFAGDVAFTKDPLGRTLMRGRAYNSAGQGGSVFNLPAGYHSPMVQRFSVVLENSAGSTIGQCRCYVSGGTVVVDGGGYYYDLSVVEFDTGTVTAMPTGPKGDKGDTGGTMGAASYNMQGWATATTVGTAWKTLTLGTTPQSDPVGAFTHNPDNSVTVRDAGWYQLNAAAQGTATDVGLLISLGTSPDSEGFWTASESRGAAALLYPVASASCAQYIGAGQKVYVTAYSSVAGQGAQLRYFSIVRVGGPQGPKGDTGATGGNATVPMDPVHVVGTTNEPAFQNGWTNHNNAAQSARFRKDPFGKVRLGGLLVGGTSGTTMFTLPVGYRPPRALQGFATPGNALYAQVEVTPAGAVVFTGNPGYAYLDGVEFDTETVTAMPTGPQGPPGPAGGLRTAGPFIAAGAFQAAQAVNTVDVTHNANITPTGFIAWCSQSNSAAWAISTVSPNVTRVQIRNVGNANDNANINFFLVY